MKTVKISKADSGIRPVSYTHLDVYKRQLLRLRILRLLEKRLTNMQREELRI